MKEKLTAKLLASLQIIGQEYEVHDTTVGGLFVRVTAAGAKSYVVTWAIGMLWEATDETNQFYCPHLDEYQRLNSPATR